MSYPPTRPKPGLPLSPASNGGRGEGKEMTHYFTGWVLRGFGILECDAPISSGYSCNTLRATATAMADSIFAGDSFEVNGTPLDFHTTMNAARARAKARLTNRAKHYRGKASQCERRARAKNFMG